MVFECWFGEFGDFGCGDCCDGFVDDVGGFFLVVVEGEGDVVFFDVG